MSFFRSTLMKVKALKMGSNLVKFLILACFSFEYFPLSNGVSLPVRQSVHCRTTQVCVNGTGQTFICSDKSLICCPDSFELPTEFQIHHVNSVSNYRCCPGSKGKIFDQRSQTCIAGKIFENGIDGRKWCGYQRYRPEAHLCCRYNETLANLYPIEEGGRCCNEKLLTNINDDCCEGIIYKKSLKTCCRIRENPTSFHEHYQLFDIINGRCCLYEAYDPSSQVCTFDGIVENFFGDLPLCGPGRYNSSLEICCNRRVASKREYICVADRKGNFFTVSKSHSTHDSACDIKDLGWLTYDSNDKHKACTSAGLYHLNEGETMCGENRVHNSTSDLCCGGYSPGYKLNGRTDGLKCCQHGTKAYNPNTQICCPTDRIYNISENNGKCCRSQAYDIRSHVCVGGSTVVLWHLQSLLQVKKLLEKGGIYIYMGSPVKELKKNKKYRLWKMKDAEVLTAKKKRLTKFSIAGVGKNGNIKIELPALYPIEKNKKYLFILARKRQRSKIIATGEDDLIFPLETNGLYAIESNPSISNHF